MKTSRFFYFLLDRSFDFFYKKLGRIFSVFMFFLIKHRFKSTGKKIRLGGNFSITGERYIEVGDFFSAKYGLWIDAIDFYQQESFSPIILIGNNVSFSDFVHIAATSKVIIGNDVLIGSKVHITDHSHGIYSGSKQSDWRISPVKRSLLAGSSVVVESNVWLCDGVIVLPGVTIGRGSVIGANSVVTHNIPEYSIAVGNPARVIKKYNDELNEWERI